MGSAILPHLVRECASVVAWNRSPQKLAEARAQGVKTANTPEELVKNADIILSILYDDAAVEDVYLGPSGLLAGDCSGRLFVEMSTIKYETIQSLSVAITRKQATLIDAPVSGSVGPARDGKLLALVGGAASDVERASSVLKSFSRRIAHLGPLGSGIGLKLGIQGLIYVYWQALGETLAIGISAGLETSTMLEVIADSPAALAPLKSKVPVITGSDKDVAFALEGAAKDLRVIAESAQSFGLRLPVTVTTLKSYERTVAAGRGAQDIAAIVSYVASNSDK
jgi:3-hydroxyisobutyrate dehydrogenase-like beta-hydroxyacid dehydrogenase